MNCEYDSLEQGSLCTLCEREIPHPGNDFVYDKHPQRNCTSKQQTYKPIQFPIRTIGFGDLVEFILLKFKITPCVWQSIVSFVLRKECDDCHCAARKLWLNDHTPCWVSWILVKLLPRRSV